MSILIKGMEMPKKCGNCPFFELAGIFELEEDVWASKFYCQILEDYLGTDEINPNCPLIEIVTCGECKYSGESLLYPIEMVCKYHLGHTYYTEADRFCCHGERRSE